MRPVPLTKAHAYGNDFLFVRRDDVPGDARDLARLLCDRHRGVGADGLIVYQADESAVSMRLWNADGGEAELSGNGVRCLAALIVRSRESEAGEPSPVTIETAAGRKRLDLCARQGNRFTFRGAVGVPTGLRQARVDVEGEPVQASLLSMGNPQCVVLGPLPAPGRFAALGRALATHPLFPEGTNVEFADVETPGLVRILIWERGVGPTASSGTGSAAAAVAAAAHGGADRALDVVAPGGTQRVEWLEEGVYLTGDAEVLFDATWLGATGPREPLD
ncbi:MAG: diaminopimelate epimerase [Acidimicrobiia bacterium]|nr:diaminopimelate epimerase [Acidimicrobiia bacterium]